MGRRVRWMGPAVGVLVLFFAGCGRTEGAAVDGGVPADAGEDPDGGDGEDGGDGGRLDGGGPDAGSADGGGADGGVARRSCALLCHGSETNDAPPESVSGEVETTARGVGAHQSHLLASSTWHRGGVCEDCHVVPAVANAPGHVDQARPADLTFGPVASAGGSAPSFDGTACAGAYCHGATLSGGSVDAPVWTQVDGTQAACGACHGVPPPSPHPASTACGGCHPTMEADGTTFLAPERHIDGVLDLVPMTCTSCHGSGESAAPPVDLEGNTSTSARGVGAHRSHLVASSTWHPPLGCDACHLVPETLAAPGHVDSAPPAELTWSALATADGASPVFDGTTCAGTYCHGATLSGGTRTAPDWTTVDGTQVFCGSCHGLPPPAPHVASSDCSSCHHHLDASRAFLDPSLHLDGVVEVEAPCTLCHARAQGAGGERRQVTGAGGDFDRPSHHASASGGIVAEAECLVCHAVDRHRKVADPGVDLVDVRGGGAAIAYDGRGASLEAFCLGCHDADGAGGAAPFADGRTPVDVASGWDGAAHAASSPAALGEEACMACHGGADATRPGLAAAQNAHGAALAHLLSPAVAGEAVSNVEEALCLACHDGDPASNVEAAFLRAPNGAEIRHHPVFDAEQVSGREVECRDCHDPHRATFANPLAGATGVDLTGTPVGPGTGRDRVVLEHEVCLKCHGDGYDASRPRTTNKRTDFAPSNGSRHPVGAPGRNGSTAMARQLLGGLTPSSTLACSDCHNDEATADTPGPASASPARPKGPHGSSQPFLLRARYWADPTGPSSWDAGSYALCLLCHDPRAFDRPDGAYTNFDRDGTENLHYRHLVAGADRQITCANCHYNSHSNQNVRTTRFEIDDASYDAPPRGTKTRGVSFSPDASGTRGRALPTFWMSTTTRERGCYVRCHERGHPPLNYLPDAAGDDDPLTIP